MGSQQDRNSESLSFRFSLRDLTPPAREGQTDELNILVAVYTRESSTSHWKACGQTEVFKGSVSPKFAKAVDVAFPRDSNVTFRCVVFNVSDPNHVKTTDMFARLEIQSNLLRNHESPQELELEGGVGFLGLAWGKGTAEETEITEKAKKKKRSARPRLARPASARRNKHVKPSARLTKYNKKQEHRV